MMEVKVKESVLPAIWLEPGRGGEMSGNRCWQVPLQIAKSTARRYTRGTRWENSEMLDVLDGIQIETNPTDFRVSFTLEEFAALCWALRVYMAFWRGTSRANGLTYVQISALLRHMAGKAHEVSIS